MRRKVFLRLVSQVEANDSYFVRKMDAVGKLGSSALQKVAGALLQLAYGTSKHDMEDYLCVAESTAIESLRKFCRAIFEIFSEEYLREPNSNDLTRLLAMGQAWPSARLSGDVGID